MTKRVTYICAYCGSREVSRDAEVQWNAETQEWELKCVQDQAFCNADCGKETSLKEVELDE